MAGWRQRRVGIPSAISVIPGKRPWLGLGRYALTSQLTVGSMVVHEEQPSKDYAADCALSAEDEIKFTHYGVHGNGSHPRRKRVTPTWWRLASIA